MNVHCPQCHVELPVPEALLRQGVARITCIECNFFFVIRLGDTDPSPSKEEGQKPSLPTKGFKSSNSTQFAAGEIGGASTQKFISSETQTLVKVDPTLAEEVKKVSALLSVNLEDTEKIIPALLVSEGKPQVEELSEAHVDLLPSREIEIISEEQPEISSVSTFETFRAIDELPAPPPGAEPFPLVAETAVAEISGKSISSEAEPRDDTDKFEADDLPFSSDDSSDSSTVLPEIKPAAISSPLVSGWAGAQVMEPLASKPVPSQMGHNPKAPGTILPVTNMTPVYATHINPNMDMALASGDPLGNTLSNGGATYSPSIIEDTPHWSSSESPPTSGLKILGLFFSLIFFLSLIFFAYVLYRNNWSFDLSNFGSMLERAFGGAPRQGLDPIFQGLEVSPPTVEEAKLKSGQRVLVAKGTIKNRGLQPRKYIYVKAKIKDRHGRTMASEESPADNLFSLDKIAELSKSQIASKLNPAGHQQRNIKIEMGESIDYMVVLTDLPPDYSLAKYQVVVELSQAEFFIGQ